MYCWIEPQCGCSICIGPPRGLAKSSPDLGSTWAPVRRTPQLRSPFRLQSLPFTATLRKQKIEEDTWKDTNCQDESQAVLRLCFLIFSSSPSNSLKRPRTTMPFAREKKRTITE